MGGVTGISALAVQPFGGRVSPFDFNAAELTFTPGMATRGADAVWAAAVAVQGKADCTGTGDVVSTLRGSQMSGHWYAQFDGYQWEFVTRWIPEFSHDVGSGKGYLFYASANHYVAYDWDNNRFELCVGGQTMTTSHNVTAGTAISLVAGGSSIRKYDATNYGRLSIDNAQTFGITSQPTASAPGESIYLGSNNGANVASGLYGGPVVIRELAWDGSYGCDMGQGDIVAAHAAGNDVARSIGSWGTTCSVPTNATPGAIVTGEGEAWSHPHSSALLTDTFYETTYGSSAWSTEGSPSSGPADLAAAEKIFPWGYKWTCDAANEGITQTIACDAGDNFVIRGIAHCTSAHDIRVRIWDETNGEQMRKTADFDFGASSSRTQPGVALFTFKAATTALTGSAADCVSFSVKVMGTANGQTVYCHQVELQDNLVDNPSLATFQGGNPDIPDGWSNQNLDAGESQASTAGGAVIHSGSDCIELATGASSEGIREQITGSADIYLGCGMWTYGDGTAGLDIGDRWGADALLQYSSSAYAVTAPVTASWSHTLGVFRIFDDRINLLVQALAGAVDVRYADDIYAVILDAVSLTAVPASAENSAETSGLRVDGRDTCVDTRTTPSLKASKVNLRANFTPRHSAANAVAFNTASYLFDVYEDANNYIRAYWSAANTLTLAFNAQGAGEQSDTWDATGLWDAASQKLVQLKTTSAKAELYVGGTLRITITAACVFAGDFSNPPNWGSRQDGTLQFDGTIAAP